MTPLLTLVIALYWCAELYYAGGRHLPGYLRARIFAELRT